jgi:lipoprotein-anchoring transpeptidase ErfK/SrfK
MMIMGAMASIVLHIAWACPAAGCPVVKTAGIHDLTTIVAVQVGLDRARFSPGVIDGQDGANTRRAMDAYRQRHGKDPKPVGDPVRLYTITDGDVVGPFAERIPDGLPEQATLAALTYTSVVEALAERFHTTPALLEQLNPGTAFGDAEQINVPNVGAFVVPAPLIEGAPREGKPIATTGRRGSEPRTIGKPDVVVTVSRARSALTVTDDLDRVVFYAPVTTGSEHDPLPVGEWQVTGIQFSPKFHYNPDLFWDADPSHSKATLADGPNSPVGVVWIDISKEHYGLHGTPEPSTIGKTASHGCVRLTNWDATKLAGLVKPGTRVIFTE